ncbi:hypothetical protein GRJ2_002744100 [Grus japonensis]|uniref:Uncharacterized protein n=1 Tax=Grus japonensis TaxID=30415 RepID=A0ABC9Y0J8_GRUJA
MAAFMRGRARWLLPQRGARWSRVAPESREGWPAASSLQSVTPLKEAEQKWQLRSATGQQKLCRMWTLQPQLSAAVGGWRSPNRKENCKRCVRNDYTSDTGNQKSPTAYILCRDEEVFFFFLFLQNN